MRLSFLLLPTTHPTWTSQVFSALSPGELSGSESRLFPRTPVSPLRKRSLLHLPRWMSLSLRTRPNFRPLPTTRPTWISQVFSVLSRGELQESEDQALYLSP